MRQFYLVNDVGTTYFLDYRMATLVSEIDDIGYEKKNTYLTYENAFKKVDDKVPQGTIEFSLVFLEGYNGYSKFLAFIRSSNKSLRLFYKLGDELKYMFVAFRGISKTQLESGVIKSTLTMDKLSLWLNRVQYSIRVNQNENGKKFPHTYPFIYSSSFNGEISVTNHGEYRAPLYVNIQGAVNNPVVEIIKDGVVISKMRLLVSSVSCTIEVNSELTDQYMTMTANGVVTNIYQNQDFTCDNFLFIDRGTYTIRFNPGVSSVTTCKVTVLEGYGGH